MTAKLQFKAPTHDAWLNTGSRLQILTDADIPGLLANLHLHIPAEPFGTFPAVPRVHRIELGVREEALVDGGDGGRGDGRGGCVGLAPRAAGRGGHRVRFRSVLLYTEAHGCQRQRKYIRDMQLRDGQNLTFILNLGYIFMVNNTK